MEPTLHVEENALPHRTLTGLLLLSCPLLAQTPAGVQSGDNAWMLVSSALVLMMTGPGLALFYCGLVRRRNVLGTMMHSFAMMAVVTLALLGAVILPKMTRAARSEPLPKPL